MARYLAGTADTLLPLRSGPVLRARKSSVLQAQLRESVMIEL
jgi:hypothetical protein